ncbi:hypothetical protein L915_06587 [Phytophthora nicotianae]|uniref:Uncharacterized protein n=1 Tax=Phytophthora nicotianae TaxID=4792 RepID=W2H1Y1_PHYNI|nr:hypothetical protein L915_06587 [Phytophthora nicotianae]
MAMRRGPFKLKLQLPADGEVNRDNMESSDSSFDEASSSESEVEMKHKKRKSDSSSSSTSSSEDDSEIEEKPRVQETKDVAISNSSSSDEDSSASDPGSSEESESEEEIPRIKQSPSKKSVATKKEATKTKEYHSAKKDKKRGFKGLKRLKRMSVSGSSGEDSELEEARPLDTKDAVKVEADEDGTEAEMDEVKEEAAGSDTDDEDWKPQDEESKGAQMSTKKWDEIVEDSDEEWRRGEWENEDMQTEDENNEAVCDSDVAQAKFVLRNILSRVPLIEETAIRRGVKLSGPPLEFATTHLDEYARKFRWPQHIRNLRTTNFSQDPSEILEDYEVLTEIRQSNPNSSEHDAPEESPFAQVPRPMVALAAEALHRSSRKRKRTARSENRDEDTPSAATLLSIARTGGHFGDHFVESLLTANGKALQGIIDYDYDKRCWSSLPTKKKPIANWRFVLEHVQRTMGKSESADAIYPPMKQETLERITKRLKKLYGYATQHEENDVFASQTPTTNCNAGENTREETGENNE